MTDSRSTTPSRASKSTPMATDAVSRASVQTLSPKQSNPATSQQPMSSLSNTPLSSADPKPAKNNLFNRFDAPALTGAAAIADQHRLQDMERRTPTAQMTSPNPAMSLANNAFANSSPSHQPMSKPTDAPPRSTPASNTSAPSTTYTSAAPVAEPMQIDSTPPAAENDRLQPAQGNATPGDDNHLRAETHSNKALTYPPPPPQPQDQTPPSHGRNMSLPNSSVGKSSGKKHRCQHCGTEFTRHHNLKSHLLTHSQEKPFPCQQCHAKFRRYHDLKRHTKLHTGERPHTCTKCGRKFARGDALARHNKGPGGCAGRRSSVGDDGEEGNSGGDDMDDVVYDEDGADAGRRRSEPGHHRDKSEGNSHLSPRSSPYRQHSSTYPGIAPMARGPSQYQPNEQQSQSNTHLSPQPAGASYASSHFGAANQMSSYGAMTTESPKPLSPNQGEPHHRWPSTGSANQFARDRSPSLNKPFNAPSISRQGTGPGTPPLNMGGPIPTLHPPSLPALPGLGGNNGSRRTSGGGSTSSASRAAPPQIISTQHPGTPGPNSATSAGSMRDILTGGGNSSTSSGGTQAPSYTSNFQTPMEAQLADNVRRAEEQRYSLENELRSTKEGYSSEVQRLRDENASFKSQLQQMQQQIMSLQQQQQPPTSSPAQHGGAQREGGGRE